MPQKFSKRAHSTRQLSIDDAWLRLVQFVWRQLLRLKSANARVWYVVLKTTSTRFSPIRRMGFRYGNTSVRAAMICAACPSNVVSNADIYAALYSS